MSQIIVVGSGLAGVSASLEFIRRGVSVRMIDVGIAPPSGPPTHAGAFAEILSGNEEMFDYFLGEKFEFLAEINEKYVSPKLKAPRFRFVTRDADRLLPSELENFSLTQGLSSGGLANAWGAGVFRYSDADLHEFGFTYNDLEPFYDILNGEIGISGCYDDLGTHFGVEPELQPPLPLDRIAGRLMHVYSNNKLRYNKNGITCGRPRLAVLTEDFEERKAQKKYDNLHFFEPNLSHVYTPRYTLEKLKKSRLFTYQPGIIVYEFHESDDDNVTVIGRDIETNQKCEYSAKKLVLAAGAVNSARIVLQSYHDYEARQPILDNPIVQVPIIDILSLGKVTDPLSHGFAQMSILLNNKSTNTLVQGGCYTFSSILNSEVLFDFPLPFNRALMAGKLILPAFMIATFFHEDLPSRENFLQLKPDGKISIRWGKTSPSTKEEENFISVIRRHGFLSGTGLIKRPEPGNGIHYAGTIPYEKSPAGEIAKYRTAFDGRLLGTRNVYIADSASFPSLVAKHYSYTVMANSMRIASLISLNNQQ